MSKTEKQTAYLVDKNTGSVEAWALLGRGNENAVLEKEGVRIEVEINGVQEKVCFSVAGVVVALEGVMKRKERTMKRARVELDLLSDRRMVWVARSRNEKGAEEIEG